MTEDNEYRLSPEEAKAFLNKLRLRELIDRKEYLIKLSSSNPTAWSITKHEVRFLIHEINNLKSIIER